MFSPQNTQTYPLAFCTAICQYVVMVCIYCGSKLTVSNSRPQKRTNSVWRRRTCPNCQAIFTSVETIDPTVSLVYKDHQKRLQPFSRDKLYTSIYEACKHRKAAPDEARALCDTVITRLLSNASSATVTRPNVISATTETLRHFDKAAASTYVAYHPSQVTS